MFLSQLRNHLSFNLSKNKFNFVVVDSSFPQKSPFAFRNVEISEYLRRFHSFTALTMYPMKPGKQAWFTHSYGMSSEQFKQNKMGYLKQCDVNSNRIQYLKFNQKYNINLAYSFFLAETYTLLPFYEQNKIPFVFVLYPGGGFGLHNRSSDNMLKKVFASKYFRQVIVTQKITYEYLLNNLHCDSNSISYIYGGFVQFTQDSVGKKQLYPIQKDTFDVCFVANKYIKGGIDKGFDVFCSVAQEMEGYYPKIQFHVVGDFSKDDLNFNIKNISFYGIQLPSFLSSFYSKMDVFLSPNRSEKLYKGSFDGFPLGIDAMYCGVLGLVADPLKMNHHYKNLTDIVIIKSNTKEIVSKLLDYYNNPKLLYKISYNCMKQTQKYFDAKYQIDERIKVFSRFVDLRQ